MKSWFGWLLLIACAIAFFLLIKPRGSTQFAAIPLSEFASRLEADRVHTVLVESDRLLGEFTGDEMIGNERIRKFQVILPAGTTSNWDFNEWLINNRRNATVKVERDSNLLLNIIVPLIPWLLIFGFIWFFVFRNLRKMQAVDPNAPRPVYIVPPPAGVPPMATLATPPLSPPPPPPPSPTQTPAPGGDN